MTSAAEAEFTTALTLHEATHLPLEKVETQLLYGGWLRRTGHPARARPILADAAATAVKADAHWLAGRAHHELRCAGGRRRINEPDTLTPAEHRTATLAAQGMTNAEIANPSLGHHPDRRDTPRPGLPQARCVPPPPHPAPTARAVDRA
ncbi:hypothetical protein [Parafrankia sp. EUN1f]|uniref:hypothetical protein n=1 Tax=Parafrankia sp. EUN1f TaxID=102897 RepID=UPI0001C43909|nr:hypothetical protein [Parafrankia sp. EUN1f]EFC86237.1 hypothetical protein FrEUN1fDRAFT_0674 [Parafrankia sp. EUN1f]